MLGIWEILIEDDVIKSLIRDILAFIGHCKNTIKYPY